MRRPEDLRSRDRRTVDVPFAVTFFKSEKARTKTEARVTLREVAERVENTTRAEKMRLPWLKAARFGDVRSDKNSLRHDANVLAVTGLEVDCDGGPLSIDDAADRFRELGVAALLYESPSAALGKLNRWRAILTFSHEVDAATRRRAVEALGAHTPGLDLKAMRGLSTAFLFGGVGDWTPRTILVDGDFADRLLELPAPSANAPKERDESGSGILFDLARAMIDDGDREAFRDAAYADPDASAHLAKQGDPDRAVNRAWAKWKLRRLAREMKVTGERRSAFFAEVGSDPEISDALSEHELKALSHEAWSEAPGEAFDDLTTEDEPKRSPLRFLTAADLAGMPEAFDFVRGLLHDGQLSVMFGPPGSGKSFLALDLAAHVALGRAWARLDVAQRGALIIALEGAGGLKRRLRAWSLHNRAEPSLTFGVGHLDLRNPEHVKPIVAHVRSSGARFVVVDTLSRAMAGGNENAPDDMGALIAGADAIREYAGAHVMLLHHTGKDEARGSRGHSSLKGAVDVEMEVSRVGEQRLMRVTKSKDGPEGFAFAFTLQPVETDLVDARGERITSAVAVETEGFEDMDAEKMKLSKAQRDALAVLEILSLIDAPTRDEFRDALKRTGWGPENSATWRARFRQLLSALEGRDLIRIDGDQVEISR